MANSTLQAARTRARQADRLNSNKTAPQQPWFSLILSRLASLKITVTLFAMAIFLVLVGTLAQVEKDVWQVTEYYFRTPLTWIDLRLFFPPSFFPGLSVPYDLHLPGGLIIPLGFYFPGGWLIGALMAINLLAAHSVRFTIQAQGSRLKLGCVLLALGALLTWWVIAGSTPQVGDPTSSSPRIWGWRTFQIGLGLVALALASASFRMARGRFVGRAGLLVGAACLSGILLWTLCGGSSARLGDSSLRILWQMCKGEFAALVLLCGCVLLFKKRAGIVLLHGGIGLMMFGEVLTGLTAVEGHMQMAEGETANYVRHGRDVELAIVDHADADRDTVVVVPQSRLLNTTPIQHADLPFDIRLVHYLKNSTIRPAQPNAFNPATAGVGLSWLAEPVRPVSGTDGGKSNMAAAYVTLLRKGSSEELGTYLVSISLSQAGFAEQVSVGGKTYDVSLRPKRIYKPYTLKLVDVTKEDYPGTDIPRHYASLVHLIDDSRHVDRTVRIWMNNPLRFAGETFYQSGYYRDPETGAEASTLAVVTNTGWMIPYVGCMLVATGLLAHFGVVLLRFLNRRAEAREAVTTVRKDAHWLAGLIMPATLLISGLWVLDKTFPPEVPDGEFQLYRFGRLPVVDQGRIKPVDTLARNSLQILSGKQSFIDSRGSRQPAIRWFLDLVTRPEIAGQAKVFRIESPEVLSTLGLEPRDGLRYAFQEFSGHLDVLKKQVELALGLEPGQLSHFQKKILELHRKLALWYTLVRAYIPPERLLTMRDLAAISGPMPGRQSVPLCIPGDSHEQPWQTFAQAQDRHLGTGEPDEPLGSHITRTMGDALKAYAGGDAQTFNDAVDRLKNVLYGAPGTDLDLRKVRFEAFYNHFEPCYHASALYLVAFVLAALGWLGWSRPLNRASFGLLVLAFSVHSFALISRIYISGRPPVTNLYSSAVFIGWAAVLFGLALELVYRMGIGNVIASVIGFATLLIAHFLANDGDTMAVLQAVLDTQFWLATHVVCITLGYTATYVAGLLGALSILRGVGTRSLSAEAGKELSRMIYGTLCFAILFSFVGTVLGGLWADDSWGRFWGWDPKENGALIIVLWNALVLHARWSGMIRQRGLAVLSVAGNIAVSWSWFGVNELGIGLHSYGFTEGVLRALGIFILAQLAIVGVGMLPSGRWRSLDSPDLARRRV